MEHERKELQSTSGKNNQALTINAEETLPAVLEVTTQTRNTGKNVSLQFQGSHMLKASLVSLLMHDRNTKLP